MGGEKKKRDKEAIFVILSSITFLLLASFLFIVNLGTFVSADVNVSIEGTGNFTILGNGTNHSGLIGAILFNTTFQNGTDINISGTGQTAVNVTWYFNGSSDGSNIPALVTQNSSQCACAQADCTGAANANATYACWAYITINSSHDGQWNITAAIHNGTANVINATAGGNLVWFDSTAPPVTTANVASLTSGNNQSGRVTLNVSITDVSTGVLFVYFNVTNSSGAYNTTITATNSTPSVWNATIDTSIYLDGLYNITVWAFDYANNSNGSEVMRSLYFDNTVPQINSTNISSPLTGKNQSGVLVLNVSIIDLTTSISGVFFNITNNTGGQNYTVSATTNSANVQWSASVDTSIFVDGTYNITVWANDSAGNLNNSALVNTIVFDNTAPTATFSCTSTSVTQGDVVTCTCNEADATSTVETKTVTTPSTSNTGQHTETCTITDYAGNSYAPTFLFTVEGASSGGSSSSSGGGSSTTPSTTPTTPSLQPEDEEEETIVEKIIDTIKGTEGETGEATGERSNTLLIVVVVVVLIIIIVAIVYFIRRNRVSNIGSKKRR